MTRTVAFCAATALGLVVTLGAQAPNPASSPGAQAPPAQTSASSTGTSEVKATGCLAKDASGSFMLNSAAVEAPAPAATGTAGTAGASAAGSAIPAAIRSATSFKLQGSGLDAYVGQKVEVNGMASAAAASASSAGAAAGAERGAATTASAANLNVKSVKSVAASCS
jgi:hypothetical protein